jgi:cytoskeleton protein RodZ
MSKAIDKKLVPQELSDDIEIVGPGQILLEGRIALGLSQEDVAKNLNFRLSLVKDIENERFDKSLPDTFNRGYLRNFAKLVHVSVDDVLASYEMLGVAEKQGAEMQSFSQSTKKQAENNRLMWVSYLIIAVIIGSTLFWFFQDAPTAAVKTSPEVAAEIADTAVNATLESVSELADPVTTSESPAVNSVNTTDTMNTINPGISQGSLGDNISDNIVADEQAALAATTADIESRNESIEQLSPVVNKTPVTFYFNGDCWVNIYDATGEHIAWGVKKADYVMNIEGVAPFTVTLGKPELVTITYDGDDIDMSQFNRGNIAKFTLPISAN